MANFQQAADVHSLDRCELPKMQCACVTLAEKLRGRLNLLCTFPCRHWIRANIHDQCGHRKVVCLFKQETPEGGEMATVETMSEPYDETQKYSQITSQLHI